MRFQKGQSGNPGGRPKEDPEVKLLARQHTKEAVERLVYWMRSENPKASVTASQALLDRGFGKPAQSVQVTGDITNRHVNELSEAEIDAQLAELERKEARVTAREKGSRRRKEASSPVH
jgi:hypothetical protein